VRVSNETRIERLLGSLTNYLMIFSYYFSYIYNCLSSSLVVCFHIFQTNGDPLY